MGWGSLTVVLFLVFAGIDGACCWATGYGGVQGLFLLCPLDK